MEYRSGLRPPTPKKFHLAPEEAHEVLQWWSSFLGLDHWHIDLSFARGHQIPGNEGDCTWTLTKCRATIRLLDPNDLPDGSDPFDMEKIIVHELLHVCFAAWDDDTRPEGKVFGEVLDAICIEQPIDNLSRVLVTMRRSGFKTFPWEEKTTLTAQELVDHFERERQKDGRDVSQSIHREGRPPE